MRSYWSVDEIEEELLSLPAVDHGGSLGLQCDASLPLHWEVVQHLLRGAPGVNHS